MTPKPINPAMLDTAVEAEQQVLSCCFMDGGPSIERCVRSGLDKNEFYSAANRTIYSCLVSVYHKTGLADLDVIAQELKKTDELASVGGYPYLLQISKSTATTIQINYFIAEVKQASLTRNLHRNATWAIQKISDGGTPEDIIAHLTTELAQLANTKSSISEARTLDQFKLPPDNDDAQLLGGDRRYITRGQSCILVSSSGMGKSSLSIQAAVTFARGLPFFGIQCRKPLRSLIIQAEDDDGDIAEVWASIVQMSTNMSREEEAEVRTRVKIVRDRINRGDAFLRHVEALAREHTPDIVWINPLQNYVDGDIADKKTIGTFLSGLNRANANDQWAYFIVHHTTKPPQADGKAKAPRQWNEVMYDMAGSSSLIDWARAIMILKATAKEGEFNLHLAKRGTRAGVCEETAEGTKPVTVIPLKHAIGTFKVEGKERQLQTIYWLPRERDADPVIEAHRKEAEPPPGEIYTSERICGFFPGSGEAAAGWSFIFNAAASGSGISKAAFNVRLQRLQNLRWIEESEHGRYKRTLDGDMAAENYKNMPLGLNSDRSDETYTV